MALGQDGKALFVCETFARKISRIDIHDDGSAAPAIAYASDLPGLPDGIAFDGRGDLFVGCYEPSRLLRISAGTQAVEVYIEDPTAHLFAHPTNIAFDGRTLYTANLGRWHITKVETGYIGSSAGRRQAMEVTRFTGLTWDHPRGYRALEAAMARNPGLLAWSRQPLRRL